MAGLRQAEQTPQTANLAHLLRCLDQAVECMNQCGFDADSQFVAAHRAQLARGREWYGDPIETVVLEDGSTIQDS